MGGKCKTANRRILKFYTLDGLLADAQTLEATGVQANGGWTAAQVISHVAVTIQNSVEGFKVSVPFPMRVFGRLIRGRMLKKGMPTGIKIPKSFQKDFVPPADLPLDEAMTQLTTYVNAAKQKGMHAVSPLFGKLTHEQWVQLHCRHAELHFSFLAPATQSNENDQPNNGNRHAPATA